MRHLPLLTIVVGPFAVSTAASAATVVLPPLLADGSVTAKQQQGVHQLIASELDFSSGVEKVVDLDTVPSILNEACLVEPRCLQAIASTNGGQAVVAGRMTNTGSSLALDLLLFDGVQVVRRLVFEVPSDPTSLANAMTPVVQELLTGQGGAGRPVSTAALLGAAPQPAAPAPQNDGDLAGMISFNQSVSDISAEEIDQMIRFGPPPAGAMPMVATAPVPMPAPVPQAWVPPPPPQPVAQPAPRQNTIAEEEAELAEMERAAAIEDMEATAARAPKSSDVGHTVQVTGRGGFSKYYAFNFVTGGAEIGVAAYRGLHLVAGAEVYAVKRVLPPDLQLETGIYSEWNTIFPLNLGMLYKFPIGIAQPYVGADAIFVQYYKDEIGSDWAGGGRLRGGVDLMFIDNFGLNINVAAGGWFGQNWSLIQQNVGTSGFLPQASGGMVVAF
ncbi:MAG: hypothetical protein H6738_13690 [Alphaproteobacteria bacterium]|nr:hypothetical protein [Alphaproteobacteria bacterium]